MDKFTKIRKSEVVEEHFMKGFNLIVVYDQNEQKLLMCKRAKEPYKDMLNFVGGKIEKNENGIDAAYRELEEETGITQDDISLSHIMDITYHLENCYLEVYVGKLNKIIDVKGTENHLCWTASDSNFFDETQYAGEGNIGHIIRHIQMHKDELLSCMEI